MTDRAAVLAELCRRLGLGEVEPPPSGPLVLDVEGAGAVALEPPPDGGGGLLVSLSWPLAAWDRTTMTRALEACSLERSPDLALQAGLSGDKILLMAKIPAGELDAPAVEKLILRLAKVRGTVASEA